LVEDFATVHQKVSMASVSFDAEAVADSFESQVDAGRKVLVREGVTSVLDSFLPPLRQTIQTLCKSSCFRGLRVFLDS